MDVICWIHATILCRRMLSRTILCIGIYKARHCTEGIFRRCVLLVNLAASLQAGTYGAAPGNEHLMDETGNVPPVGQQLRLRLQPICDRIAALLQPTARRCVSSNFVQRC